MVKFYSRRWSFWLVINGRKEMKKVLISIVVILVIAGVVWMNIVKDRSKSMNVRVESVVRERIEHAVSASGKIQPITEIKISAEVSARIEKIFVKEGDAVQTGDLLLQLDPTQLKEALEQYRASLQSKKFQLKKAKADFERTQILHKEKLVSDAEWESVQAQYELQVASVKQSESSVRKAEDELSKTRIVSPIDGIVTNLSKEEGEIVVGGMFQSMEILRIANLSMMEVLVDVDETDVVDVSLSDSVKIEIDAFPDRTFLGKVTEISHSASVSGLGTQEQVTTFQVTVTLLETDSLIRPGMSATVDIQTDVREKAIAVPIQAVTARSKQKEFSGEDNDLRRGNFTKEEREMEEVVFVFVDGKAERRSVELGISSDTKFEIVSGLEENEKLIVGPFNAVNRLLEEGKLIKIEDLRNGKRHGRGGKWNKKRGEM